MLITVGAVRGYLRRLGFEDAADSLAKVEASGADLPQGHPPPHGTFEWAPGKPGGTVKVQVKKDGDKGVVLPAHYSRHSIEPTQFAVANLGPSFLIGNIIKYLMRYDAKDGHKDLAKAARYIEMLRAYEAGDPDWYKASPSAPLPDTPDVPLRSKNGKAHSNG